MGLVPWPAAVWREEREGNITAWIARVQVLPLKLPSASCTSSSLKPAMLKEPQLPCSFCCSAFLPNSRVCWAPAHADAFAHHQTCRRWEQEGTRWQKELMTALPTWSTLVMLNLLVAYPLSLLRDLCVTFRTLSYFSLTSLFSLCRVMDFKIWEYCE